MLYKFDISESDFSQSYKKATSSNKRYNIEAKLLH